MTTGEIKDFLRFIHKEFYFIINKRRYKFNKIDTQALNNFSARIKKDWGSDVNRKWLYDYMECAWNLYFSRGKVYLEKARFTWMVGKPAYERWLGIKDIDELYWKGRRELNLSLSFDLPKIVDVEDNHLKIFKKICEIKADEEKEKDRFFNTPEGYVWCLEHTNLFNHRSTKCAICRFSGECKARTKEKMPKTYLIRGYE